MDADGGGWEDQQLDRSDFARSIVGGSHARSSQNAATVSISLPTTLQYTTSGTGVNEASPPPNILLDTHDLSFRGARPSGRRATLAP